MQLEMQESISKLTNGEHENGMDTQVKLARSRRETRVTFVLKGSLDNTEERLQKIYKSVTKE